MDCKQTLRELFNRTGNINYYLLLCAIDEESDDRKE